MRFLAPLILFLSLTACSRKEEKPVDHVTFPVRGVVVSIDSASRRIMIDHEEIPDYMMAMTMPFKVKDPRLLSGKQPGDSIQGVLVVSRTESWLEALDVVGEGSSILQEDVEARLLAKMFRIGDHFPNDSWVNQEGKNVRFSAWHGKTVAVTFIYTRCPLPDFCILMNNNFHSLQSLLSADPSLANRWQLVTISFDPAFDTPTVLRQYGTSYGADFAHWEFITAEMSTIFKLTDGLGLSLSEDGPLIAHNLRTVVLDTEGKIVSIRNGNEWKPQEVADEMRQLIRTSHEKTFIRTD